MFVFRRFYFIVAIVIFIVEVLIALYVNDSIIRPHIGDLLVVIMIYCFVRAFLNWNVWVAAIVTLLFSYLIEILQYFKIVQILGMQKYAVARIVIGTSFSWIDLLAYTIGIALVLFIEKYLVQKLNNQSL